METVIYIYTIFSDWKDLQTLYKLSDFQKMRHAICTLPSGETIYADLLDAVNSNNNIYTASPAIKQVLIKANREGEKCSSGLVFFIIAFHTTSYAWK